MIIDPDTIESDLQPFADPATDLSVLVGDGLIRLEMVREGRDLTISVLPTSGEIKIQYDEDGRPAQRGFKTLTSLLASDLFANVKSMVENQRRMLDDDLTKSFLEPQGEINSAPFSLDRFAQECRLFPSREHIRVILVDGPAGVGKTSLIRRTAAGRARDYGTDSMLPPILHVASRGRRLVSLDETIALSIQLIRAKFTYDQVPSLVRNGVVQLAVDGFDELVDADGYADAWTVLREFLGGIGFGGPVLLSGRDTFFDLNGFREKLGDLAAKTLVSHVRLAPATPAAALDWLRGAGWPESDLRSEEASELFGQDSYALRPYFLSEIAKTDSLSALLKEFKSPREYLVLRFIGREADLITQRVNLSSDQAFALLVELFEMVALEMADAETESVDVPFLQVAVEVVFGQKLTSVSDLAKLRHKAGSFALLEADLRQNYRRFPHTEISNHFLSSALIKALVNNEVPRYVKRGHIGPDLLSVFCEQIIHLDPDNVIRLSKSIGRILIVEVGSERLAENAASLAISSLTSGSNLHNRIIEGCHANEVVLFGNVDNACLRQCSIVRIDARGADLSHVRFEECAVGTVIVDKTTRFGLSSPSISVMMVEEEGRTSSLYRPNDISSWVADHSVAATSVEDGGDSYAIELLSRVCRVFLRQFYIKENDSDHAASFLQDPLWNQVDELLSRYGRIRKTDRKDAGGRPGTFVHIVNAAALLARESPEDLAIWKEVGAIDKN